MRRYAIVAVVAALAASPAHATEVAIGDGHVRPDVHDDGGACFEVVMNGPITGTVTATGLVSTKPSFGHIHHASAGRPTDVVSGVRPIGTTHDSATPCLDGAGRPALSGWVVFTVTVHAQGTDHVVALRCSYREGIPACV